MAKSGRPSADESSMPTELSSDVVSSVESPAAPQQDIGPVVRVAYWIGSAGLLAATSADAIAVVGRHIGVALLGSIEIVQTAIVLIASASMVAATILKAHASVHLITQHLSEKAATRLARVSDLLSALVFAVVACGSIWIAVELWNGFERTELLGIPLRWLRALWIAAIFVIIFLFVRSALRRVR